MNDFFKWFAMNQSFRLENQSFFFTHIWNYTLKKNLNLFVYMHIEVYKTMQCKPQNKSCYRK